MDIQEKIEAYFAGKLNEEEMRQLESEMEGNPDLKKEFELQSDITEALKQIRVAELKGHLDNVPVNTGILDNTLVKILSSAAIITGASLVGYFTLSNQDKPEVTPQQEIEVAEDSTASIQEEITSEPQAESIKSESQEENTTKPSTPKPVTPDVIEEFSDEETHEEIAVPENEVLESAPTINTGLGVEIKTGTQYDFHYKFQDSKLFLYGDFNEEPYDILEIRSKNSSSLFFAYKDKFYGLDRNQETITSLVEIEDTETLSRLRSIRQNQ